MKAIIKKINVIRRIKHIITLKREIKELKQLTLINNY